MPLVRISLMKGKSAGFGKAIGEVDEGRTMELKKAFYRTVAERLHKELGVRMEDVFINLVEVKKENWSFGNGMAQYAQ